VTQGRRSRRRPSALPLPLPGTGTPRAALARIPLVIGPRAGRLTVQHDLGPRSQRE
jgi:hypothetical protein